MHPGNTVTLQWYMDSVLPRHFAANKLQSVNVDAIVSLPEE